MIFCSVCSNMYRHIITDDTNQLIYFCNNCGNKDSSFSKSNVCVSKCYLKNNNDYNYALKINEYTKLDPTLPRINTILCPNVNCDTNKKDTPREIIYIRYDDINMKYLYLCSTCDTSWKANSD